LGLCLTFVDVDAFVALVVGIVSVVIVVLFGLWAKESTVGLATHP